MAHTLLRIYRKTTQEEIVMKKIKNSIRFFLNTILTTLVGMFITSCEEGGGGGTGQDRYDLHHQVAARLSVVARQHPCEGEG